MADQPRKKSNKSGSQQSPEEEQSTSGEQGGQSGAQGSGDGEGQEGVGEPPQKLSGVELVNRGKRHLQEMTGKEPEMVSGLERQDGGWRLTLEVLELSRIPPSTDVLGTYELDLDEDGELAGYRRSARYYRNQAQGA